MFLLVVACGAPTERIPEEDAPAPATAPNSTVVGWSNAPFRWSAPSGWDVYGAISIGDVTGDGITDALASAAESNQQQAHMSLLIEGPLTRDLTLPGDEFVALADNVDLDEVGDVNGDGIGDLQLSQDWGETLLGVVLGPITRELDATMADPSVVVPTGRADADSDGDLDTWTDANPVQIWWGPFSLDDAPDSVLEFTCSDGGHWPWTVDLVTDVTGDGLVEAFVSGGPGCGPYVVPVPVSGTVDGTSDPQFETGIFPHDLLAVPDQDTNGSTDVLLMNTRTVLAAPVSFFGGGVVGTEIAVASPLIRTLAPTSYDLNGDHIADFLGELDATPDDGSDVPEPWDLPQADLVVVAGGSDGLGAEDWTTAWEIGSVPAAGVDLFLDTAHLWALVENDSFIVLYDLGPAVEVGPID